MSIVPKVEVVLEVRREPQNINSRNNLDTPAWLRQRARIWCASSRQYYFPSIPRLRFRAVVGNEVLEYIDEVSLELEGWNKKKAVQPVAPEMRFPARPWLPTL